MYNILDILYSILYVHIYIYIRIYIYIYILLLLCCIFPSTSQILDLRYYTLDIRCYILAVSY